MNPVYLLLLFLLPSTLSRSSSETSRKSAPSEEARQTFANEPDDGTEVSVATAAAAAEASSSTEDVCPFARPCVCFAGRIICSPVGPRWESPLVTVSSGMTRDTVWYDLRIEGIENVDFLPSAASIRVKNLHITRSIFVFVPVGILAELSGVQQLNLSQNRIGSLRDSDFLGVPSLQQLDLGQNLLRTIADNAFASLTELRQLTLAMNSLLTVPAAVRKLRKLTHLDLHGNPIAVIDDFAFNNLGRLLKLDLSQLNKGVIVRRRAFCGLWSVLHTGSKFKLETGLNELKMQDNTFGFWDPCSLYHLRHIVRRVDFMNTKLDRCSCFTASLSHYFRLTMIGGQLVECTRRLQDTAKCKGTQCVSYCTGSGAGSSLSFSHLLVGLISICCFSLRYLMSLALNDY